LTQAVRKRFSSPQKNRTNQWRSTSTGPFELIFVLRVWSQPWRNLGPR
jgi:hypothetical protein